MRWGWARFALMLGASLVLAGCGFADSRSLAPEFMRAKAAEPLPPEPPPDTRRLVGEKLDSVFTPASHPLNVRVSQATLDPSGRGWTACVRAELTSVIGKPLGTRTYRLSIVDGVIFDRRQVEADDTCASEDYAPV